MNSELFYSLTCNAALLLSLGLIYDLFQQDQRRAATSFKQLGFGILIGLVALVLMATPARWVGDIIFDTRTILLSLTGLFFGPLPTLAAMAIAAAYRISLGGSGMLMGVATILVAGGLGLAWRHWRWRQKQEPTVGDLYLFGMVVHLGMIACMPLLPPNLRGTTFRTLTLPILILYPVATALLGHLLASRQRRQRIEAELHRSEGLHRSILQTAMDGIWRVDRQGRLIEVNDAYCRMSGYRKEELLTLTVPDLDANQNATEVAAHIDQAMTEEKIRFESRHRRKDGTLFDVEVSVQSLAFAGGQCVAFLRDITARKQAEEELRLSRQQYRDLVEGTPDLITRVDTAGRFIFVNHAAESIFGPAPAECLGRSSFEFIHPADRAATEAAFAAWLGSGEDLFICENRQVGRDGREHHMTWSIRAERGRRGKITGFAGTGRDITAMKHAETERSRLENQLQQAQRRESLGVLAGGIAHDFNNILMAILGNADLALTRLSPESPALDNLRQIETAARRAADLAGQMLAYSGRGRFVIEPIGLNRLIEEMTHILRVSISKKAVLRFVGSPELPSVEGDATQLRQIVMNLVINASEAIGDRSGVISVSTGLQTCDHAYLRGATLGEELPAGDYACIEVADTGCGMDAHTLAHLFEPFFSTKFTGRGLGMAATLGIVRGHKGAIQVYSEVGKGTTFKVLLPATSRAAAPAASPEDQAPWHGEGTILLVDDEEVIRTVGREMLEELGYQVLVAEDGREALTLFRERQREIQCVLMDLTMPHMDGEQAFRELRQIDPGVRVIITSGYSEQEVSQKFLGKGLAGFLQKPFRISTLRDTLRRLETPVSHDQTAGAARDE
ncbi:hypothetical protein JCM30471_20410 [Desulfuromonas carbonis]|uniref:PAS domain S-box protein n=1 Tax=Desulfuromonas sp. DDH964 TaxID=1823759 RepID=UPI00078E12FE|nr:PAS domain S-box protein [Desulfuromonas sp. DDH964]AMV73623.1 sensor histidine kinase response regulator [Desulfuromonas sp. DDH964]